MIAFRADEKRSEKTMDASAAGKPRRFPQLSLDRLNAAQKPVADQIMKVSSVGIGRPYNSMQRGPVQTGRGALQRSLMILAHLFTTGTCLRPE
jgi:hypothetical protein